MKEIVASMNGYPDLIESNTPSAVIRGLDGLPFGYVHVLRRGEPGEPGEPVEPPVEPEPPPVPPHYPLLSQRDPRWEAVTLGYGYKTIGEWGCLLTDLTMALDYMWQENKPDQFDLSPTPAQVNDALKSAGGYSQDGYKCKLIWSRVPAAAEALGLPGLSLYKLTYCTTTPAPVDVIDTSLARGDYVIVQVDSNLADTDVDEHWVLITGGNKTEYVIHDPWLLPAAQKELTMPLAYCKPGWTPDRAIFAVAIYGQAK